jgi:hypothetical protein
MKRSRWILAAFGALALNGILPLAAQGPEPLTVLTVGGGPTPNMNQVAIESNVRYVDQILPKSATNRILFADGKPESANVLYLQPDEQPGPGEQAVRILLEGSRTGTQKFRKPELRAIDGPTRKESIRAEIGRLTETGKGPILLYFTGHGERGADPNNNFYSLWTGERMPPMRQPDSNGINPPPEKDEAVSRSAGVLTVRELAAELKKIPANRPVTLVMVQCFSGAFANLLFEGGNPVNGLVDRPFCGFFAATPDRMAAGCTPEINEADYKDFTSYFFAALVGKDRTGRTVTATDFDKNGVVGMDEAYIYALINEDSVDVPVVTSDFFLRRFVTAKDDDIAATPYSKVREMASPAQRGALDSLSTSLKATGEDRLETALADYRARRLEGERGGHGSSSTGERDALNTLQEQRQGVINQFPQLQNAKSYEDYLKIRKDIVARLDEQPVLVEAVLKNNRILQARQGEKTQDELAGARWLRLFRLAKSVVLEDKLRKSGDATLIQQYDRLRAMESKNPLK